MTERALFYGFQPYKLTGIKVTEKQLGHGSYATVHELEYMGMKCAGKKIHDVLLEQGDTSYTVRRFEEECRLLSQVRHPNIVQFLGVHFRQGQRVPTLVMEFLPTNLTSCIEQYGILPKEISYSILHDVALGLCYLHNQASPIIHRDLSSNNVLLTANMTAKISDLGVARILNLSPLQVTRMTNAPGTPAYMPPEVMIANPRYNTSIDEFSYGVLMIHMFSGQWPEPQVGPSRFEDGHLVPVTEAERREVFLRAIGNDHPLMDLILKCVNNDSSGRAHASELVERLAEMSLHFPASFANRLEMLKYIEMKEHELEMLKCSERKDSELKAKTRALEEKTTLLKEKDFMLTEMSLQLAKAREHLSTKQQDIRASITWKQCATLPVKTIGGMATAINGKIYYGGGWTDSDEDMHNIYCYSQSQDSWTTLPPLPVRNYGMGQMNGKLVTVGGWKMHNKGPTNEIYTYNETLNEWKQVIPPMPTARYIPGVLSLQSALVVGGGGTLTGMYTHAVEIFKPDTSEWYTTTPLPAPCRNVALVAKGNTCYVIGGYRKPSYLNQVLYASINDLLHNAVAANQTSHSSDSVPQLAWKTLPNTPTYQPAAAVMCGNLLVVGGNGTSEEGADRKEVYISSPSTNSWIYLSDLPAPRSLTTVTSLSSTEVLVIGGWCGGRMNTVYKGTLRLEL